MLSFCRQCGATNFARAEFCRKCGAMVTHEQPSGIKKPREIWLWIVGFAALASLAAAFLSVANTGRIPERELGPVLIWSTLFGGLWWRWRGKQGRYGALIGAVTGVVVLVGIGGIGASLWARGPSGLASRTASAVNQTVPRMIDAETRLDGAEVGRNGELMLRLSLVALPEGFEDVGAVREELHNGELAGAIVANICGSEPMRALLDKGLRLVNLYADSDGNSLGSVAIDSSICSGQAP